MKIKHYIVMLEEKDNMFTFKTKAINMMTALVEIGMIACDFFHERYEGEPYIYRVDSVFEKTSNGLVRIMGVVPTTLDKIELDATCSNACRTPVDNLRKGHDVT